MSLSALERKVAALDRQMRAAAAAEDFELAASLLAEIRSLRGEAGARQPPPGEMGLGTHIPVPERPSGWTPPKKPDPLTANVKARRGRP
jgi:hypothetical protein